MDEKTKLKDEIAGLREEIAGLRKDLGARGTHVCCPGLCCHHVHTYGCGHWWPCPPYPWSQYPTVIYGSGYTFGAAGQYPAVTYTNVTS